MTSLRWTDPLPGGELAPYPWTHIRCPGCFERELTAARHLTAEDFVCMACGTVTKIEAGP